MMAPAIVAIPIFFLFKTVGLLDTVWALMLIYAAMNLSLVTWIIRSYMLDIPHEIEDAARTDGASDLRILVSIIAPMCLPGIVTAAVIAVIFAINEFLFTLLIASTKSAYTLSVALANFTGGSDGIIYNAIALVSFVAFAPVLLLVILIRGPSHAPPSRASRSNSSRSTQTSMPGRCGTTRRGRPRRAGRRGPGAAPAPQQRDRHVEAVARRRRRGAGQNVSSSTSRGTGARDGPPGTGARAATGAAGRRDASTSKRGNTQATHLDARHVPRRLVVGAPRPLQQAVDARPQAPRAASASPPGQPSSIRPSAPRRPGRR